MTHILLTFRVYFVMTLCSNLLVWPVLAQKSPISASSQLLEAISRHDSKTVEVLLKQGADANAVKPNRNTALMEAAANGDIPIVKALLAHKAKVNVRGEIGDTPLIAVLVRRQRVPNRLKVVQLLLDHGADVNARNNPGYTALLMVGNRYDLAQLLICKGADVNAAVRGNERTPLMNAALTGHLDIARLLLAKGAHVNAQEVKTGKTALHHAVMSEKPEMVRLLVKHGANIAVRDASGDTPQKLAQALNRPDMTKALTR